LNKKYLNNSKNCLVCAKIVEVTKNDSYFDVSVTGRLSMKKSNYVLGAIGAIVGGMICTIPWIIVQVYLGKIAAVVAILIGFGAFKSYQIFKGKTGPATKWIIISITVFLVIIAQIETINVTLLRNNAAVNAENIKFYLSHSELGNVIFNFVLGMIMALLGLLPVFSYLGNDKNENDTVSNVRNPKST